MDWQGVLFGSLLVIAAVAAYGRTFLVPFLYDDGDSIPDNASIRHLATAFFPPANASVSGRPFLNLSLALNYAAGGTAVWGYHAVNLAIHVLHTGHAARRVLLLRALLIGTTLLCRIALLSGITLLAQVSLLHRIVARWRRSHALILSQDRSRR